MKKSVYLSIALLFLGLSGQVFAGEVHIGGVNIDGHQYGGTHSDSGRVGPIHQEERFQMHGGQITEGNDEVIHQNPAIRDQYHQLRPQYFQSRTPTPIVLRNIYETTGPCDVYEVSGIFNSKVGELNSELNDSNVYNLIEDFWNGISGRGASFKNTRGEWFLIKGSDGGLDLQKKR